ncbi:hypothetical protein [Oryzihumus leptocrescens]|uniref:Uncharacterized protein n=1 Tax=Oryzihumus leptocrescens TaxID=297536 RepID=A0A542ZKS4_9MICO|nr:hypothetical protein [Oryzihumus leptocrescens]TQL60953.1 hypothetical protein FB474_2355 [Oryzihumus leptocrescens]
MSGSGESPTEAWARNRLEPFLGHLELADVPGTTGKHDFEHLEGETVTDAVEVTAWTDSDRSALRSALSDQTELRINSKLSWSVSIYPLTRVEELTRSPELPELLAAAEQQGVRKLPSAVSPELISAVARLGIEAVFAHDPAPGREGVVRITTGTFAASGWDGPEIDKWLDDAFAGEQLARRVRKLERANADRRHLFLALDTDTSAGMGVSLALDSSFLPGAAGLAMPNFVPPTPLTDLWLWPRMPGAGLRYSDPDGWSVVQDRSES